MLMKMLQAGGMELAEDGVRAADEDNPRGYFELERVKELGDEGDKGWVRAVRGRAVKVISFLLKDLPAGNNYQVLFLQRDLEEVLASQRKMLERREESSETDDARLAELYADHLWRARYLLDHDPRFAWIEVSYAAVLREPRVQAERIAAFLGRALDLEAMASAVDAALYRNRAGGRRPPLAH
jgi:hypothetical protein